MHSFFSMKIEYDKWQRDVLDYNGHFLLCTGRQVGKTTTYAAKAAEYMVEHAGSRIIVVSLTEDQAELIIIMTLTYLEQNHKEKIKKGQKNITKKKIILKNKSQILARPVGQTGDAVRGFTGDVLIIDEAAKMPESIFTAAKPTLLTTGGQIWMCSTPFGKQGYFYESWLNKNNRFKVFHISSEEVIEKREIGDIWTLERREGALRMLDEEKKDMTELQYGQEYLGKFMEDLTAMFTEEWINKVCVGKKNKYNQLKGLRFMGVDIARLGKDKSAFQIFKRISADQIVQEESIVTSKQLTTQTFDRIKMLDRMWNFKKIGIDAGSGSLGVGIFDFLKRIPIIRKKVIDLDNKKHVEDHLGEKISSTLKEAMYATVLMLGEQGKLELLDDDEIRLSLASVQEEYVKKEGQRTKIKIYSTQHKFSDIIEGIVRAVYLANQKHINTQIDWI